MSANHTVKEVMERINDENGTKFNSSDTNSKTNWQYSSYEGNAFETIGFDSDFQRAVKRAGFDGISAYEIGELTFMAFEPPSLSSSFS